MRLDGCPQGFIYYSPWDLVISVSSNEFIEPMNQHAAELSRGVFNEGSIKILVLVNTLGLQ